jgi:hypothetical protein
MGEEEENAGGGDEDSGRAGKDSFMNRVLCHKTINKGCPFLLVYPL